MILEWIAVAVLGLLALQVVFGPVLTRRGREQRRMQIHESKMERQRIVASQKLDHERRLHEHRATCPYCQGETRHA